MQFQSRFLTGVSVLLALTASSVVAEGEHNNLRVAAVHVTSIIARAPDNIFARQLGSCPEATQTPCDDGNGCCQSGIACSTSRGIPICNVACTGTRCAFGGCCPVGYRCYAEQTACIKMGPQEPNSSLPTSAPSEINSEVTGVFTPTPPSLPEPSAPAVPTKPSSSRDTNTAGDGDLPPEPTESTAPTDPLPSDSPDPTVRAQSDTPNAASGGAPLPGLVPLVLSGLGLILRDLY